MTNVIILAFIILVIYTDRSLLKHCVSGVSKIISTTHQDTKDSLRYYSHKSIRLPKICKNISGNIFSQNKIMGLMLWVTLCVGALAASTECTDYASDPVIQQFLKYLQIDTTSNNDLSKFIYLYSNV